MHVYNATGGCTSRTTCSAFNARFPRDLSTGSQNNIILSKKFDGAKLNPVPNLSIDFQITDWFILWRSYCIWLGSAARDSQLGACLLGSCGTKELFLSMIDQLEPCPREIK